MAKVFISYRRTDSAPSTGRIYDRLVAKRGRKNVFKDVDDIPPGVNFATYIQDSLRQCNVALVVIGRDWLDSRDANGSRRLDDPFDFVRIEIETALQLGLTLIPILLEGTSMPPAAQLPESLRRLALINGIVVRNDPDFTRDMERVITAVERAPAVRPAAEVSRRRSPRPSAASNESSARQMVPAPAPVRTGVMERPAIPARRVAPGLDRLLGGGARPLGAAVAALLIITSLGVLLSQHGLPILGGAQPTKTTSRGPTATSTTDAFTLPYNAKAPGPSGVAGCDPGALNWQPNAFSRDYLLITCPATPQPHLHMENTATTATAEAEEQAIVTSGPAGGNIVPSTYTVSIQMSGFSSGSTGHFQIEGSSTGAFSGAAGVPAWYTVEVNSKGGYTFNAYSSQSSQSSQCQVSSSVDVSAPIELALAIAETNVTLKVNDKVVKTCNDTAMAGYNYRQILLGVVGAGSTVDYANFSITA